MLERGRDVKHPDYPTAMMESWQFAGRNRLSQRRSREAGEAEPHRLHHAPGVGALVRQRRREPPTRRCSASTGCAATTSAGGRCSGAASHTASANSIGKPTPSTGSAWTGQSAMGDPRAVVQLRRALCGYQRQPRGTDATARRSVPAADGDELPRAPGEGSDRQDVRRPRR